MNVKHGLIQSVDLGLERIEQASTLTKSLGGHELRTVKWHDLLRGENLSEESAFLTGMIPTFVHRPGYIRTRGEPTIRHITLPINKELS